MNDIAYTHLLFTIIEGQIPTWLKGRFLRVGPSKFDFPDNFQMNHWLDGYAMLSSFEISPGEGSIRFHKRFLQSDAYKRSMAAKKPVINEFATRAYPDPNKGIFSRVMTGLVSKEFLHIYVFLLHCSIKVIAFL